jgi:hypothetical protein
MTRLVVRYGYVCPNCEKHSIKRAAILPDLKNCFFEFICRRLTVYDSCWFCNFEHMRFLDAKEISTFSELDEIASHKDQTGDI